MYSYEWDKRTRGYCLTGQASPNERTAFKYAEFLRIHRAEIESALEPLADYEKNPHAVELGRLGGLKGGRARANALTSEERIMIARKAAKARWEKRAKK